MSYAVPPGYIRTGTRWGLAILLSLLLLAALILGGWQAGWWLAARNATTDPIQSCPSIGLGIPDSAELSNPQQVIGTGNSNAVTVGQMDPFGVCTPSSSMGTFVDCVNAQGQECLVRWEGFVEMVTAPAVWDCRTHAVVLVGAPTISVKTRR